MKKISLFLGWIILFGASCNKPDVPDEPVTGKRFVVLDENGEEIQNNQEFIFSVTGSDAALHVRIKNLTDEDINIKSRLKETNANGGMEFQVCMGNCYPFMSVLTWYPTEEDFIVPARATTSDEEVYFTNYYSQPCYYVLEIAELNENGEVVGESVVFKYVYQP